MVFAVTTDNSSIILPRLHDQSPACLKRPGSSSGVQNNRIALHLWNMLAQHAAPLLRHPNYTIPMEIHSDTSGFGIGAVLVQRVDGYEHETAYTSRLLRAPERNYFTSEKSVLTSRVGLSSDLSTSFETWRSRSLRIITHYVIYWRKGYNRSSGTLEFIFARFGHRSRLKMVAHVFGCVCLSA